MATINNITVGQILWDYHNYKTNGGGSKMGCWPVEVIHVFLEDGYAVCRWNGNPTTKRYTIRDLARLKVNRRK